MKYVLSWENRAPGGSQTEADVRRVVELVSKWQPPAAWTITEWVARIDGEGGYAVIQTDNAAGILAEIAKFGPYVEFSVHPVVDQADAVQMLNEGIGFRNGIS
jgi:hypothetical protein